MLPPMRSFIRDRSWTPAEVRDLFAVCQVAAVRGDSRKAAVLRAQRKIRRSRFSISSKITWLRWYEHGRWNWGAMNGNP